MSWQHLVNIVLTDNWQMSPASQGEIFRITHTPLQTQINKDYLKAVISPAFIDDGINLLSPKRLTYREEKEVFIFYFPQGVALQQLAFKRLDNNLAEWTIGVEVFVSASGQTDFSDYLSTLIESKIRAIDTASGLNKIPSFLNNWLSFLFAEKGRSLLGVLADKDANLMVAGKGICTLFLTLVNDSISLEELKSKKDFKGLDIAEWVFVGSILNPQAKAYLDTFGKFGLKEYGMLIWTSYQNKIGAYLIMNRDGTTFISGK